MVGTLWGKGSPLAVAPVVVAKYDLARAAIAPPAVAKVVWVQRVEQASRVRHADDAESTTQRVAVPAVAAGRCRTVRVNGATAFHPIHETSCPGQITRLVRRLPLRPATQFVL